MEKKPDNKKVKTYKREVAIALLSLLFYMAFTGMLEALELLVVPVFGFAIVAFGMDSAAKQMNLGNATREETQYDDR